MVRVLYKIGSHLGLPFIFSAKYYRYSSDCGNKTKCSSCLDFITLCVHSGDVWETWKRDERDQLERRSTETQLPWSDGAQTHSSQDSEFLRRGTYTTAAVSFRHELSHIVTGKDSALTYKLSNDDTNQSSVICTRDWHTSYTCGLPPLKYLYHLTLSNFTSKHTILPRHNFLTT